MKKMFLKYIITIVFLLFEIGSKIASKYVYSEKSIENNLIPRPQQIIKGENNIEINADETQIIFNRIEPDQNFSKGKNIELYEEIIKLYSKILKGDNHNKKIQSNHDFVKRDEKEGKKYNFFILII